MRIARLALLALALGCGSDIDYETCESPDDCSVPDDATARCISGGGDFQFCSWECGVDADCNYDEDEWSRVCATFESENGSFCFPSCDGEGDSGGDEACPEGFECRATGGGDPRRVCFPNDAG